MQFTPRERIDIFLSNPKNVVYLNEQTEGEKIYTGNINGIKLIIFGLESGSLVLLFANFIYKNKEKEVQKSYRRK